MIARRTFIFLFAALLMPLAERKSAARVTGSSRQDIGDGGVDWRMTSGSALASRRSSPS